MIGTSSKASCATARFDYGGVMIWMRDRERIARAERIPPSSRSLHFVMRRDVDSPIDIAPAGTWQLTRPETLYFTLRRKIEMIYNSIFMVKMHANLHTSSRLRATASVLKT